MRPSDIAKDKYLVTYKSPVATITLNAIAVTKGETKTTIITKFGIKTVDNSAIISIEELTTYESILYREQDEINAALKQAEKRKRKYNVSDLYEDANPSFEG
jgi:hypothetical protein